MDEIKRLFMILGIFALATALILSSTLFIAYPFQVGNAQPQNSTLLQPQSLLNTTSASANISSAITNNTNVSIISTGEAKFVEPETLATSSLAEAGRPIAEPENP